MRQSPFALRRQLRLEALEDRNMLSATTLAPTADLIASSARVALINDAAPTDKPTGDATTDTAPVKGDTSGEDPGEQFNQTWTTDVADGTDAAVCWISPDDNGDPGIVADGSGDDL